VPEPLYLGDNGAMIAYTGKLMLEHGIILPVADSHVNPAFRSDEVEVTWRKDTGTFAPQVQGSGLRTERGAEAVVEIRENDVVKSRCSKAYRMPTLDHRLIAERTRVEARLIAQARRSGVPTPIIRDITENTIVMERIEGTLLKHALAPEMVREAGKMVGRLHSAGIIHGDLTTSNLMMRNGTCVLIDFGLAQVSSEVESRGVDIHVFFQTLKSTTPDAPVLRKAFIEGYRDQFTGADEVLAREKAIEKRGRYL
ncbi:MAG: Kae1-associated kinase Bud32, partial [Methanomicrobiales archaeon]|nr:Kae1-associated kinase Bud32 [Methanomicrobiales archaeon]